jgi:hypothetical protein
MIKVEIEYKRRPIGRLYCFNEKKASGVRFDLQLFADTGKKSSLNPEREVVHDACRFVSVR